MGAIDQIPTSRRRLLTLVKLWGSATIAELAAEMEMTGEAVRQQLAGPERDCWVERAPVPRSGEAGRPAVRYRLTARGEQLFPKDHAGLAVAMIDAIRAELGDDALLRVLGRVTDARVAALQAAIAAAAPEPAAVVEQQGGAADVDGPADNGNGNGNGNGHGNGHRDLNLAPLAALYGADDPFLELTKVPGGYRIVERNCPFLDVALQRPLLCSSTVTVLTRVLGRKVVREERFQDGHGRCVFRVYEDEPVDVAGMRFVPEPERPAAGSP